MIFSPSGTNDWNGSEIAVLSGVDAYTYDSSEYDTNQTTMTTTILKFTPQSTSFLRKENITKIVKIGERERYQ